MLAPRRAPHPRAVAVPRRRAPQGRAHQDEQGRRDQDPARRRRLHLPEPPGLRGRHRLRAALGRPRGRRATPRLEARRCAGSSRCGSRTTPTTTATSPPRSASGSGATGARAAPSSTGGAPRTPRPSSTGEPVYETHARRDRRDGRARRPTTCSCEHVAGRGQRAVPSPSSAPASLAGEQTGPTDDDLHRRGAGLRRQAQRVALPRARARPARRGHRRRQARRAHRAPRARARPPSPTSRPRWPRSRCCAPATCPPRPPPSGRPSRPSAASSPPPRASSSGPGMFVEAIESGRWLVIDELNRSQLRPGLRPALHRALGPGRRAARSSAAAASSRSRWCRPGVDAARRHRRHPAARHRGGSSPP